MATTLPQGGAFNGTVTSDQANNLAYQRAGWLDDDFHKPGTGNPLASNNSAEAAAMRSNADIIDQGYRSGYTGERSNSIVDRQKAAVALAQEVYADQQTGGAHALSPAQVTDVENMLDEVGVHFRLDPTTHAATLTENKAFAEPKGLYNRGTGLGGGVDGNIYAAQAAYNDNQSPGAAGTTVDDPQVVDPSEILTIPL